MRVINSVDQKKTEQNETGHACSKRMFMPLMGGLAGVLFLTSCSQIVSDFVDGAKREVTPVVLPVVSVPSFSKGTFIGAVSGSRTLESTLSGYKVRQSADILLNKQFTTTANGYKVYVNLNGRLTDEENSK